MTWESAPGWKRLETKEAAIDLVRRRGKTMATKEISREEMINKLVNSDLDGISAENSIRFLIRILCDGWRGYNEMSDSELKKAYNHREFSKTAR